MKAVNVRPITELKNRTKALVAEVVDSGQSVVITQNGVPRVVALRDLERIATRLHEVAPLRADKILERILSRGESLTTLSHPGRTPPELRPIADRTWLEVIEAPWRILYRIVDNAVEIHAVLDGRRDLRDILLERLLD